MDPLNPAIDWTRVGTEFRSARPFHHVVIDDFFAPETARALADEYPAFDAPVWWRYDNPLENKRACNDWNRFPPTTYRALAWLNSDVFVARMSAVCGAPLFADIGLNGGGWHCHGRGGKLNVHLDYSLHPKLALERRLNLIVYLSPGWDAAWGGGLGLWEDDGGRPGRLGRRVDCLFNRAVLFDTTQNSWHGLPEPIECPEGRTRNSLAVYYLCEPRPDASDRGKALYAPYGDQVDDPRVLELIRLRADVATAHRVWVSDTSLETGVSAP